MTYEVKTGIGQMPRQSFVVQQLLAASIVSGRWHLAHFIIKLSDKYNKLHLSAR